MQTQPQRGSGRWWLPPLAEVVFVAVLLWVLVGGQARALLADGDTGWHIRTGEYILAERRVPRVDLFSFSRPEAEWFAWEWASDVLFALAHRAAGLEGVVLLSGALIAATSARLFHFMIWQRANVLVAVVTMLVATSASTVHWLARPHLFTSLLFVLSLGALEADRRRPGRRAWTLVAVAVAWANLHGGFVILPLTTALYAVAAACVALERGKPHDWRAAQRYGFLTVAVAAATLANPYGYRLHVHIWKFLGADFIRKWVEEFQSPRFRGESMLAFELLLLLGLLSVPWLWRQGEFATALLLVAMAHAALGSVRHVVLYVLAATPVVARRLSAALEALPGPWGQAIGSLVGDCAPRGRGPARHRAPLWAAAALALSAAVLDSGPSRWQIDFPKEKFPQAALAATEKQLVGRRVLTSDQWADYLIYRYYPEVRVFIDGRSDFYGRSIGQEYLDLMHAQHRWEETLNRNGFDRALLPPDWPLATVLKAHPDWRLDYDDGQALLLRRVSRGSVSSVN